MKNAEPSYEALQSSWFSGERLTPAEEQRRLELARQDPLFAAECAVLEALKQRLEVGEPTALDNALIARVLADRSLSPQLPHLRLVRHEEGSALPSVPARFGKARAWSFAMAAVVVLALFGGWLWQQKAGSQHLATSPAQKPVAVAAPTPARAELVFVSGELSPGLPTLPLGGRPLAEGAVVETAAGQACLTIDPGVDVCLGAFSRAEVRSLREGKLELQVTRGLALATLTHRAPGQTFSLVSGDLKATAIGTTFGIDARGTAPEVVVLEGKVEVKPAAGARSEFVRAHSRWRATPGAEGSQSAMGRAEEAPLWALLAPRELWRHSEVGILELRSETAGLNAAIDESHHFFLPLSTFLPAGRHRLLVRNASGVESSYAIEVGAGERQTLDVGDPAVGASAPSVTTGDPSGGAPDRSPAVQHPSVNKVTAGAALRGASAKPSALSPTDLLERARRELRAGNVSGALNGYSELRRAFPGSPEAWTVLPIMGRLELEQRKAPARALALFDTYLSRPGPLRQEALSGKIRALKALERNSEEQVAIDQFLKQYPNSLEASALKQRLHTFGAH